MTEPKTPAADLTSGIGSILNRIGEFFHIFDLSYFVGGVLTLLALLFAYRQVVFGELSSRYEFPADWWLVTIVLVIASYACGLVSFSAGRALNTLLFRSSMLDSIGSPIKAHDLEDETLVSAYYEDKSCKDPWRLYIRMWSEIAHDGSYPVILHHLMRYWAISATYDSVGFAALVWAGALIVVLYGGKIENPTIFNLGIAAVIACLLCAGLLFWQAARYFQYQIEDVVAHFAVIREGK